MSKNLTLEIITIIPSVLTIILSVILCIDIYCHSRKMDKVFDDFQKKWDE